MKKTYSPALGMVAALSCSALTQMAQAQDYTFDWANVGSLINNVAAGNSYTANNVGGSTVDFTFTFTQELDSRTDSSFSAIVNADNPGDLSSGFTGNGNREGLYTNDPLYLVGKSDWAGDKFILTITLSEPIEISNLIIGDIDRLVNAGSTSAELQNSFEDRVAITSSLNNTNVGVTLSSTSTTINIDGNTAESISGAPLDSTNTNSQITVDTTGLVDSLTIVYSNADHEGLGLANAADEWSNSHWITLGTDDQLLEFSAVPEPSSTALLGLGSICLLLRRKR